MEFDLKLTVADLSVLNDALGAMPYLRVAHLIAKINAQIAEQEKRAAMKHAEVLTPT